MNTIRAKDVARKMGVGIATVWRLNKTEDFPKPFRVAQNVTLWDEGDIDQYLTRRKQESIDGSTR